MGRRWMQTAAQDNEWVKIDDITVSICLEKCILMGWQLWRDFSLENMPADVTAEAGAT